MNCPECWHAKLAHWRWELRMAGHVLRWQARMAVWGRRDRRRWAQEKSARSAVRRMYDPEITTFGRALCRVCKRAWPIEFMSQIDSLGNNTCCVCTEKARGK
jgi:hypothetical protein